MISADALTEPIMPLDEIRKVVEQSSRNLLRVSSPPVRYWLLTQVGGKSEDSLAVQKTLDECGTYPPMVKLLAKLREDGTWPIPKHREYAEKAGPGPPIGWTYRMMLWNLFMLAEYRASSEDRKVVAGLEKILSWQTPEGYIPGPWTRAFPLPHFNGHALHVLARFGMERDPRVQRLAKWLLSIQRADGGWNIPYLMDIYYLPEYKGMRVREFTDFVERSDKSAFDLKGQSEVPSCIWTSLLVLWGLAESPRLSRSKAVERGASFVLNRFFRRNYHATFYKSETHWTKLNYPIHYGSGLMATDVLTRLGFGPDDPRMEKPMEWLADARSADGLWSQSKRPHPERDQWISLYALRALSRYASKK